MTYTAPTDDILYNDDGVLYGYEASGEIFKGQVVSVTTKTGSKQPFVCETYAVTIPTIANVGVAVFYAEDNDIAIAGPGCIVRCIVAAASVCTAGDTLWPSGNEGKVANIYTIGDANVPCGVALETQASADGTVLMMVK